MFLDHTNQHQVLGPATYLPNAPQLPPYPPLSAAAAPSWREAFLVRSGKFFIAIGSALESKGRPQTAVSPLTAPSVSHTNGRSCA